MDGEHRVVGDMDDCRLIDAVDGFHPELGGATPVADEGDAPPLVGQGRSPASPRRGERDGKIAEVSG